MLRKALLLKPPQTSETAGTLCAIGAKIGVNYGAKITGKLY
jgi:hypothetical protein